MKSSNTILILVMIMLIVAVAFFFYVAKTSDPTSEPNTVCYKNSCFNVEIVDTPALRQQGLMNRELLGQDKGMLFIFEKEGVYPFWMKDTLIPLDIIWLNEKKEVVYISHNTKPCEEDPCPRYNPEKNALFVLEINAGKAAEVGLKVGDKIKF